MFDDLFAGSTKFVGEPGHAKIRLLNKLSSENRTTSTDEIVAIRLEVANYILGSSEILLICKL